MLNVHYIYLLKVYVKNYGIKFISPKGSYEYADRGIMHAFDKSKTHELWAIIL